MGQDHNSHDSPELISSGDYDTVHKSLNDQIFNHVNFRISKVIIQNETNFDLEFCNHGSKTGVFDRMKEIPDVIKPNECMGYLHQGYEVDSLGYVSYKVSHINRTYTLVFGFKTGYKERNCAGIEIRMSDGQTDELGKIGGHGVDATGGVISIDQLVYNGFDLQDNLSNKKFSEESAILKVHCSFRNQTNTMFTFKVTSKE
jgi:hypothetical protein